MRPSTPRSSTTVASRSGPIPLGLMLIAGLAWTISGCSGGSRTSERDAGLAADPVTTSGLASLSEAPTTNDTPTEAPPLDDGDLERLVRESADSLDELFARHEQATEPAPSAATQAAEMRRARQPQTRPIPEPAPAVTQSTTQPEPPTADMQGMFEGETFLELVGARRPTPGAEPAPEQTPGDIRDEIALRLAEVLESIAAAEEDPAAAFRAAAGLAGLEAIRPGLLDGFEHTDRFTTEELSLLKAASSIARTLGSEQTPDTGRALEMMSGLADDLAAERGMRIRSSELCTSVSGYGRTRPFAANRFLAGRAQPVIVYTEVERFRHRDTHDQRTGESLREVRLSQRLELYHEVDGLNVWNKAAQIDRSESRNELRDYYLIHQVTLPEHLTVGRYVLKVVMQDLNDEHGAVDEALIPIEIVSDPAMAYPNARRLTSAG